MIDEPGFVVISGDATDPVVVAQSLNALSREIHVAVSACSILMAAMTSILACFDGLSDEAHLRYSGPARQVLRDHVDKVREKVGPHPLLTEMENLCGREPLKLVVTDPIDPAA